MCEARLARLRSSGQGFAACGQKKNAKVRRRAPQGIVASVLICCVRFSDHPMKNVFWVKQFEHVATIGFHGWVNQGSPTGSKTQHGCHSALNQVHQLVSICAKTVIHMTGIIVGWGCRIKSRTQISERRHVKTQLLFPRLWPELDPFKTAGATEELQDESFRDAAIFSQKRGGPKLVEASTTTSRSTVWALSE